MRRLHQTLADYVVIAISPALIMLLVGSLVYFLLAVLYQGDYQERLYWVMTCFVFAAVLIARISIEEGFERAVVFGAPLAILMGIAANQFMEIQGTWIDHFGWLVNYTLIAVVWWCTHKLTWDCTVIDDAQDASGEGLMQIAGLERPADARNAQADLERKLEGTTSRQVPAGYWQRYTEHQRRPHAPGVWVVYFSLAALPIFGIGQWFIPASNTAGRRYVFWLLCIYVAAGLGLLLTTSFLGLRRYLRQRRIEMPTMMANLWLGTGVVIVLALLVAAALLPRPSAEYAISRLPFTLGSPEASASKMAPLQREGTEDEEQGSAAERTPAERQSDEPKPSGEGNQPEGEAEGDGASGTSSSDSKSRGEGNKGQSSSGKGQQQDSIPKGSQNERGEGDQGDEQDQSQSDPENTTKLDEIVRQRNQKGRQPAKADDDQPPPEEEPAESDTADEPTEANEPSDSTDTPAPPESFSTPSIAETAISPLLTIFQWVIYALFILAVLYVLWRYWHDVLAAIRNFLVELRNWWDALWGNRRDHGVAADETPQIKVPPSPFSSYADPFASGLAARYSIEELVRYSFEAFEAWAREHGCPREPEQTPHELARDVGRLNSFLAADARNVAELYARAAYSQGSLPSASTEHLRQLWQKMHSTSGIRTVTAGELQSRT